MHPVVANVTERIAACGPIARVQDGDVVRLDADAGTLTVRASFSSPSA